VSRNGAHFFLLVAARKVIPRTLTASKLPLWPLHTVRLGFPPPCSLAPHTNGPRDVPRSGALSLLQKTRTTRGVH
jgi:hypothetical protein